mgnify:CR=1 FL=1
MIAEYNFMLASRVRGLGLMIRMMFHTRPARSNADWNWRRSRPVAPETGVRWIHAMMSAAPEVAACHGESSPMSEDNAIKSGTSRSGLAVAPDVAPVPFFSARRLTHTLRSPRARAGAMSWYRL